MKKLCCILLALVLTLTALTACNKGSTPTDTTAQSTTAADTTAEAETSTEPSTEITTGSKQTQKLPVYVPGSIRLVPEDQLRQDENWSFMPTYRMVYYSMSSEYTALAPSAEELKAWEDVYDKSRRDENGNLTEPNEMILVSFVKHFNIPKEDFEKAIDEQRKHQIEFGQNSTGESFELPNADIIYTFDNAVINKYYLRANG